MSGRVELYDANGDLVLGMRVSAYRFESTESGPWLFCCLEPGLEERVRVSRPKKRIAKATERTNKKRRPAHRVTNRNTST